MKIWKGDPNGMGRTQLTELDVGLSVVLEEQLLVIGVLQGMGPAQQKPSKLHSNPCYILAH